ncbi:maleylpyruvate isomerase N-terminal domain-containing protein [Nakamurella sp. GG22]
MDGSSLQQSARASTSFLSKTLRLDWDSPIPDMTWSVREVVAHISEVLLWYSTDLSAEKTELSTMVLKVRPTDNPADLLRTITAFSAMLGYVADGVPPGHRGWHPDGLADSTGFAAMGCDEILIHTYDAALGLGLEFEPSEVLSQAVLRRLFPWAPKDTDTWQTLLWANGRRELNDRPRQVHWHRHPAPLSEWDGTVDEEAAARRG